MTYPISLPCPVYLQLREVFKKQDVIVSIQQSPRL